MTTEEDYANLSICGDCLMLLANGEVPLTDPQTGEEWSHEQAQAWEDSLLKGHVTLGVAEHDDDCDALETGGDCFCEQLGFSSSSCDNCKSSLGGDRFAATLWVSKPNCATCTEEVSA